MSDRTLPALPYDDWEGTKTTFHLMAQVVGKVRLARMPRQHHWWHAPLYVSSRGITTRSIPVEDGMFEMEFDLPAAELVIRTSRGEDRRVPLAGTSVAAFFTAVRDHLRALDLATPILARPFDPDRVGNDIPFAENTAPAPWDRAATLRFWRTLQFLDRLFEEFRGVYLGKCSPVHFFWHSFDLAVTRFSGRPAPLPPDADPVTREAYSHEVMSAGFWPGDPQVRGPHLYAYLAPEPDGLADEPLAPAGAWWQEQNGAHLALLAYEDVRAAEDPAQAVREFLAAAFAAGARRADWPRETLAG